MGDTMEYCSGIFAYAELQGVWYHGFQMGIKDVIPSVMGTLYLHTYPNKYPGWIYMPTQHAIEC